MRNQRPPIRHINQRGIGLPAAIFVITLMAVIAVGINQLVGQNAQTYQEEINLTRTFYAAESGAGLAMNALFPPEEYPAYSTIPSACTDVFVNFTDNLDGSFERIYSFTVPGLNQCTATVTVTAEQCINIDEVFYVLLESEGSCGGLTRTIQVRTAYD